MDAKCLRENQRTQNCLILTQTNNIFFFSDIFYSLRPSGHIDDGIQHDHIDDDLAMTCDNCLPSCSEEVCF